MDYAWNPALPQPFECCMCGSKDEQTALYWDNDMQWWVCSLCLRALEEEAACDE